jgi:hypothetical protein
MDYFRYIFYLGIVYVVFSLIWFFIAQGLKFLLKGGKEEQPWQGYFLKVIQYYFIASLTLLKASEYISTKPNLAQNAVVVYLLGGVILYLYLYGKYERAKQFSGITSTISMLRGGQMKKISIEQKTKYVPHIIGITIIFYLVALQMPTLVTNSLNNWFLVNINDFYDTILIKWILGIIGFFFMLGMIVKGLSATGELVQQVIGLLTGKPYVKKQPKNPFGNMGNFGGMGGFGNGQNPFQNNAPPQQEPEEVNLDDDDYVDFEYVDEDDSEKK